MNCSCGAPIGAIDQIESEILRTGKTMCRECRFCFLEFHELETEPIEVLRANRIKERRKELKGLTGILAEKLAAVDYKGI